MLHYFSIVFVVNWCVTSRSDWTLGGCAYICTHRLVDLVGEPSLDAISDKPRLMLIIENGLGTEYILPRGDARGEHSPDDRRDGAFGAELIVSRVHAEAQRVSPQLAASFSLSPNLREGGKSLSNTKSFSLPPNKSLFFIFLPEVLVLSHQLRVNVTPGGACFTEPPRLDSMNIFWSSLGTLVSLIMGADILLSGEIRDLMMGIGEGAAIGLGDAMSLLVEKMGEYKMYYK